MRISYKELRKLLTTKYHIVSLNEFLTEYGDDYLQALVTAEVIDDQEFIETLTQDRSELNAKFEFFLSSGFEYPLILRKNKNLTLHELAKVTADCNAISIVDFRHLVEDQSVGQDMAPTSVVLQFDIHVKSIRAARHPMSIPTKPNDPCPCGKTKNGKPIRFKNCHG